MITIEKTYRTRSGYPLERLGNPDRILFFDIETTGFSADHSVLYLIGCTWFRDGCWHLIQWFSDALSQESSVLSAFFSFLDGFDTLVHFNGDTFDLPYLKKRAGHLGLSWPETGIRSVDIYKRIKPWKKYLGLNSLKQKSIETFLGIQREDLYDGGQLIDVYRQYLKTGSENLLNLLLLHNEDDLKGMPDLLPVLSYPDYFSQKFLLSGMEKKAGDLPCIRLHFDGTGDCSIPVPLNASVPSYWLEASGSSMDLFIRLYEGKLKYFYPNYRDYYYLIYEDTAIHKSVGEYVDKGARVRATKETCYTKKSGIFLPQPAAVWTPDFRNSCRDRSCFFEFCPECFSDAEKTEQYRSLIVEAVFG